jgi:hypothetical protein
MKRRIRDRSGRFDVSVCVHDENLWPAIEHQDAEAVFHTAVLMAFAALAQAERWPDEVLRSMSSFMEDMRESLLH